MTHYCTFEYDDFPRGGGKFLRTIDQLKERFPNFKVNCFAIPQEMTPLWFKRIKKRREWVRLYPHGFLHTRGECRHKKTPRWQVRALNDIEKDDRWGCMFKAPMNGYSEAFVESLLVRGMYPCITSLKNMPYPIPPHWKWWCKRDEIHRNAEAYGYRRGYHVVSHPRYGRKSRHAPGAKRSAVHRRNVKHWSEAWEEHTQFAFVEDLVKPALVKIHVGCGPHVWDGWVNLDPRDHLDPRIRKWSFDEILPFSDNKADIIFSSHTLNYLEESQYHEWFLEAWRVLRPGGVYRMSEDRREGGYIWRHPGQGSRNTGTIKSCPSEDFAHSELRRVGFEVVKASPQITISPHKDVFLGNTRKRHWFNKNKHYTEAIKSAKIDLARVRRTDPRATTKLRYRMP